MNILYWAIFAAGLAFFVWQKTRDWGKSSLQPLHLPPGEKNPLTKGKDGYFSQERSYIVNGVVIAVFTVLSIVIPWEPAPAVVGGLFLAWGLYVMDGIRKDIERLEANKTKQLATLALLKSDPEGDHLGEARLRGFGKKTVWVFGTFYDFHTDVLDLSVLDGMHPAEYFTERERAEAIMRPKLIALAQKPVEQQFKLGRHL